MDVFGGCLWWQFGYHKIGRVHVDMSLEMTLDEAPAQTARRPKSYGQQMHNTYIDTHM